MILRLFYLNADEVILLGDTLVIAVIFSLKRGAVVRVAKKAGIVVIEIVIDVE